MRWRLADAFALCCAASLLALLPALRGRRRQRSRRQAVRSPAPAAAQLPPNHPPPPLPPAPTPPPSGAPAPGLGGAPPAAPQQRCNTTAMADPAPWLEEVRRLAQRNASGILYVAIHRRSPADAVRQDALLRNMLVHWRRVVPGEGAAVAVFSADCAPPPAAAAGAGAACGSLPRCCAGALQKEDPQQQLGHSLCKFALLAAVLSTGLAAFWMDSDTALLRPPGEWATVDGADAGACFESRSGTANTGLLYLRGGVEGAERLRIFLLMLRTRAVAASARAARQGRPRSVFVQEQDFLGSVFDPHAVGTRCHGRRSRRVCGPALIPGVQLPPGCSCSDRSTTSNLVAMSPPPPLSATPWNYLNSAQVRRCRTCGQFLAGRGRFGTAFEAETHRLNSRCPCPSATHPTKTSIWRVETGGKPVPVRRGRLLLWDRSESACRADNHILVNAWAASRAAGRLSSVHASGPCHSDGGKVAVLSRFGAWLGNSSAERKG
eukprot:TRINITY_DN34104_c0_g1_i1.p1 TRINITY_DN34104_c0_g1~~TRINITY_DN34104_c0_g1_i1.p1  ORF type:complete len:492 (+),score=93.45 TRINITY_DN34104_c0_g1_i1:112-1587(+)